MTLEREWEMNKIEAILEEAAQITAENPDDIAQGYVRITLTTGDVIAGRIDHLHDGWAMMAQDEHTYAESIFPLHIRIDHIVTFQYGTRR
ncbi:hypothetical protein LITTLEE_203 [Mycobacterium phage LittleE]|uniref:Uncharacterized protein n=1 Tax=Mycobacterium phage LittleE TaxID=2922212 RepID=G1D487_9CAUD|nr:hypothetical protein FGG27_gp217 [Mycobacterium phage LittleE]AEK09580.1 hypothetical protein LITTLEE_203 [Mycobacterium phage LittleE]